ncbi:MAG: DnaJ like chaperone protein [Phenylobacterium sp.]|jgi:DnaJ like chaperone protein
MWGKVVGVFFGFMFGRWFGAVLGLYVGHLFDRRVRQNFGEKGGFSRFFTAASDRQAIFFHATFSTMGHIAKSNGRVSEVHIQAANMIMDHMKLKSHQKKEAQEAFREGKLAGFDFESTLKEFSRSVFGRREILQMFLEIQIQAAYSDGVLSAGEKALLHSAAKTLGFKSSEMDAIFKRWEAEFRFHQQRQQQGGAGRNAPPTESALKDAYRVLGVSPESSSQEVKKAYKKQMTQHHPDKLVSKGLPPEMMEMAKRKAQDIQAAYDLVRVRG